MRKLASIQTVDKKSPIDGADKIEVLEILGWSVVSQKDTFAEGDRCVFVEIDSRLPEAPWSDFLKSKNYKVKTAKLRGQISQGLALPLNILPEVYREVDIGTDVSAVLGITKIEPEAEKSAQKGSKPKGIFPSFIFKTDVERLQSIRNFFSPHIFDVFSVTEKLDGTSCTVFIRDGKFGVCSRNLELEETDDNMYWQMARQLHLEDRLKSFGDDVALQGELVGHGIQKNPLMLTDRQFFAFDIFLIKKGEYLSIIDFYRECIKRGIQTVPFIENIELHPFLVDVKWWETYSDRPSAITSGASAEGIVVKHQEKPNVKFKVINPEYLLDHDR